MIRYISGLFLIIVFVSCEAEALPIAPEEVNVETGRQVIDFSKISPDSLIVLCSTSSNRNKSIGVLGGSYTITEESAIVKNSWCHYLNCSVTDYGKSGYGFSINQGSIQDEADNCDVKDIYVLWASTNDFNFNQPAGIPTDFTFRDNYSPNSRITQCGGINYCIKTLKEKNPNCLIVMISSSLFLQSEKGYNMSVTNGTGKNLVYYVNAQWECCRINKVPFLNLLDSINLTREDFCIDCLHYNENGYNKLVIPSTLLIAQPSLFM